MTRGSGQLSVAVRAIAINRRSPLCSVHASPAVSPPAPATSFVPSFEASMKRGCSLTGAQSTVLSPQLLLSLTKRSGRLF